MWKLCCLVLLLPTLALAQSADTNVAPAYVNPIAGAKLWPKPQSRGSATATLLPSGGNRFDGIRNYYRFNPLPPGVPRVGTGISSFRGNQFGPFNEGTPSFGQCAIPLFQFRIPTDRNFTMQQIQPPDTGDAIVSPPSVPACAAR
jgi:hypothetical protein